MRHKFVLGGFLFSIILKRWRMLLGFVTPWFSMKLQFRPDHNPMPEIGFNVSPGLPFMVFLWPVFFCFYTREWSRAIVDAVVNDGYIDQNQQRFLARHPEVVEQLRDFKAGQEAQQ